MCCCGSGRYNKSVCIKLQKGVLKCNKESTFATRPSLFYIDSMKQFLLLWLVILVSACNNSHEGVDSSAHKDEIEAWRQQRHARLLRPTGWLTLVGLFWLHEGANSCGIDSTNQVVFPPERGPARAGTFWRTGDSVWFESSEDAHVTSNAQQISRLGLLSDGNGTQDPTMLEMNSLLFYVIKRGDELGVRVKDTASVLRKKFKGMEYFPVDPTWRINARFDRYETPVKVPIGTTAGTMDTFEAPGAVVFSRGGTTYRLDAVVETGSESELFIMFMDGTSGKETYGGGRQLYAPMPDSIGDVILDFNKAYNWPCVFTEFATCPIPPKQNRLQLRIEAGEKMYAGHE